MFVLSMRVELHLGECRSLKAKRSVIKPIIEGARRRYQVSVAEVAHQDQWQRTTIGVAVVASSHRQALEVVDAVEGFIWSFPEVDVLEAERAWLEAS